jgi:isocitrate dehydrogenase kinase/phosphatase
LAALCANAAYRAFLSYQAEFHKITRRAADRFLRCDWLSAYADAAERLGLYGRVLDGLVVASPASSIGTPRLIIRIAMKFFA